MLTFICINNITLQNPVPYHLFPRPLVYVPLVSINSDPDYDILLNPSEILVNSIILPPLNQANIIYDQIKLINIQIGLEQFFNWHITGR